MSTLNEREAILRRALHAAADGVEPGFDGLERIRARLGRPRPLLVAWIEGIWTDLWLRAPAGLRSVFDRVPGVLALAWTRFGPRPTRSNSPLSRTLGWLRPVTALAVTVFIVAAGAYVAISAQQAVSPSSANQRPPHGAAGGPGDASDSGKTFSRSHSPIPSNTSPSPSTTCKTPRKRPGSSTSSPSQIQSTSPSTSPSSTGSPSPSTSDSGTSSASSGTTTGATNAPVAPASDSAGALASGGVTTTAVNITATTTTSLPPCGKRTTTRNPGAPSTNAAALSPPVTGQGAVVAAGRLNDEG